MIKMFVLSLGILSFNLTATERMQIQDIEFVSVTKEVNLADDISSLFVSINNREKIYFSMASKVVDFKKDISVIKRKLTDENVRWKNISLAHPPVMKFSKTLGNCDVQVKLNPALDDSSGSIKSIKNYMSFAFNDKENGEKKTPQEISNSLKNISNAIEKPEEGEYTSRVADSFVQLMEVYETAKENDVVISALPSSKCRLDEYLSHKKHNELIELIKENLKNAVVTFEFKILKERNK